MINSNFKLFCPGCVCEIKGNQADFNGENKKKMNLEKKECIELAQDLSNELSIEIKKQPDHS